MTSPALRRPARSTHGSWRPRRRTLAASTIPLLAILVACSGRGSTLTPAGPRAETAIELHWIMFGMSAVVLAIVLGLLGWSLARRGRPEDRRQGGLAIVVLGGIVLPLAMLPVVWAITIGTMAAEAAPEGELVATIDITGRQWVYEVRCEGAEETMLNELHIPVGEPVLLRVTSEDVVHSFWVPKLAGKQDMIPGEVHELWIQADEPGEYLVQCGEFCGAHHADHTMTLFAGDAGDCGVSASSAGGCCG